MSDHNYVAVICGTSWYKKDIKFYKILRYNKNNTLYIIHNNCQNKWWQDVLNLLQQTDWLNDYFTQLDYIILRGLGKFTKLIINVADAYLLPSNKVSNIITLKAKIFSPNSWYKHIAHVLENY